SNPTRSTSPRWKQALSRPAQRLGPPAGGAPESAGWLAAELRGAIYPKRSIGKTPDSNCACHRGAMTTGSVGQSGMATLPEMPDQVDAVVRAEAFDDAAQHDDVGEPILVAGPDLARPRGCIGCARGRLGRGPAGRLRLVCLRLCHVSALPWLSIPSPRSLA